MLEGQYSHITLPDFAWNFPFGQYAQAAPVLGENIPGLQS
jgi:hypothetical protein